VAVALRGGQIAHHILKNLFRGFEAEWCRVTDVQFENALTFIFQALGMVEHRATNVVADVMKLLRFPDRGVHGVSESAFNGAHSGVSVVIGNRLCLLFFKRWWNIRRSL